MKKASLTLAFLLFSSIAYAQAARPTDKFSWDINSPSLTDVQRYRWDLELDGNTVPTPLVATCTATATAFIFACNAPIPPVTPSQHVVRIRAVDTVDGLPLEGPWSDPLQFNMRATPNKPNNLSIARQ